MKEMSKRAQTSAGDPPLAFRGSSLVAGCGTNFKEFEAVTINRSGSFELDISMDRALPLFTALGEKLWISTWDPVLLHGDGYEEATVWVTTNHGQTTYWYVATYNTTARRARYVRVTPGADIGTVDVSLAPNGKGGSIVTITYQLTGLSEAGNENIAKLHSENEYAVMMEDWRTMINENRNKIDDHLGREAVVGYRVTATAVVGR